MAFFFNTTEGLFVTNEGVKVVTANVSSGWVDDCLHIAVACYVWERVNDIFDLTNPNRRWLTDNKTDKGSAEMSKLVVRN